jgi:hypothetical protein
MKKQTLKTQKKVTAAKVRSLPAKRKVTKFSAKVSSTPTKRKAVKESAKVRSASVKRKAVKSPSKTTPKPLKRKTTKAPAKVTKKRSTKRQPKAMQVEEAIITEVVDMILSEPEADEPVEEPLVPMKRQALMNVSFAEAMQARPLLGEVSKQEHANLLTTLASHSGDLMATALTGASVVMENGSYAVRFTEAGAKLLNAGELRILTDSAGKKIATLVQTSGKCNFTENARMLGPMAKGTRIAANLSIAVVTAAHIISGADVCKKLNKLGEKVDFLVAAHRIDQLARIEAVYRQAKEILHLPQTEQTRMELHRLGRELFEVRSAWRQEILFNLNTTQKTEESQHKAIAWFQSWFRKGKDEKVSVAVTRAEVEIQLISSSFAIHLALAQASGTLDTFMQVSLKDELEELKRVTQLMNERISWIDEKHPELKSQISETIEKLEAIRQLYGSMVIPQEALC